MKNDKFFSVMVKRIILLLIIAALLILISISCKKEAEITTNVDTTRTVISKPNIINTFDFLISVFIYNETTKNFELTNANLTILESNNDSVVTILDTKTNQITLKDNALNYTIKVTKQGYENYSATFTSAELKAKFYSPLIVVLEPIIDSSLTSGLVAYYPFNGNANDESGNGNNGTVNGATLVSDRYGNLNSAYQFDGISSYISVPNSSSLQISGQITMSVWMKTSYTSNYSGVIFKAEPVEPRHGYFLNVENNYANSEIIYTNGSLLGAVTSTHILTDDLWHHVAVTYDGNFIKIYFDGNLDNQINYTSGMQINNEPLLIGWDQNTYINPNRRFTGIIDDIRIYNRALSNEEIQLLYNE